MYKNVVYNTAAAQMSINTLLDCSLLSCVSQIASIYCWYQT